ncbi:MAG: thioredoxin domain-containing protein [Solirubrobacteraceae bacterium]|nr:thioredoxin domain-containing protein [Solirubrobacteraceae bacterium]
MPNALAHETSPYLLQHAGNPVDWLPWGPEALRRARELDRPILVSIGYSSCHWCHVMERECFEDPAIAAVMNEHLVCVKVDREERPDVDALYMDALQAMTGHGGWPLNMFVTPDQVPFFGGTYYPPSAARGMPAWPDVVRAVAEAWRDRRDEIEATRDEMVARLAGAAALAPPPDGVPGPAVLDDALDRLRQGFDSVQGGFGGAPKFPPHSALGFLLAREDGQGMALQTLRSMASGGIYDQVGGGFSRYAVDAAWTVPHFEKMLYDNALLARAYVQGYLVSGDAVLRRTAEETLDWALREMRGEEGGFFAALDADSEGVEGRYYVWTVDELRAVLGPDDGETAIAWFGATAEGNFEGTNVLERRGEDPPPEARDRIRAALYAAREQRVRPGLDDKRLTSWNALMVAALADAGAVLGRDDYLDAARTTADFLLTTMRAPDGMLLRTYSRGEARINGYLEDHAYTVEALLRLYEATFEPRWFLAARDLADLMIREFGDPEHGGFFSTAAGHEALVARRKDLEDAPIPGAQSSAALGLLRLAAFTGDGEYEEHARGVLAVAGAFAARHPTAFGYALQGLDFLHGEVREVALVGEDVAGLAAVVREQLRPHVVVAAGDGADDGGIPLLRDRPPLDGRATAYVCERFACQAPVTTPEALRGALA